ncbi:Crossover junction endodeoxyribonuclease RuvC [Koleobacter methoxysyntrophicus]|jgi:crossover junction endodeoxyribonuclease RuvC|uniref:Crossover junction endodeoxyribonuclease RuvC n=1 Tax=Koleobacter methoxysyntrophicus TaxID=2751313 RepID=A0A8A0RQY2_9FIRM|nr:crossover junction endodeoxyribonuclease RuvC [Koleobacter methoxysyntrophicus]MDI3540892.1 crossover junction endodeoxyribonuclease RuvC [Thermosediminibacterales bacterium]MDK2901335.1 crossover junction endodeoxyribonuclease RuvC [Thermosediminibacterales bacterium]QSQ09970.1 Crossover junction endodeoxyribonuclease RuvC [Koleobacter methoxysyntrophicus]
MIVMGIDPGIALTGYGILEKKGNNIVVVKQGCIITKTSMKTSERLLFIYKELVKIIKEFQPDRIVIEELFFNKNAKTAILVGQARGVAILAAANLGINVWEYTPLQVKQAVVGYGRAPKNQVQEMVKLLLGLKEIPQPDDVADALAVALCHLNSWPMEKYMTER